MLIFISLYIITLCDAGSSLNFDPRYEIG